MSLLLSSAFTHAWSDKEGPTVTCVVLVYCLRQQGGIYVTHLPAGHTKLVQMAGTGFLGNKWKHTRSFESKARTDVCLSWCSLLCRSNHKFIWDSRNVKIDFVCVREVNSYTIFLWSNIIIAIKYSSNYIFP